MGSRWLTHIVANKMLIKSNILRRARQVVSKQVFVGLARPGKNLTGEDDPIPHHDDQSVYRHPVPRITDLDRLPSLSAYLSPIFVNLCLVIEPKQSN